MNTWTEIYMRLSEQDMKAIAYRICKGKDVISEVRGPSRKEKLVRLRVDISRQARKEGFTLQQIGDYLHRDHTTIHHYLKNYKPA